eukprot:2946013-Rhodomonas_salina.2
MQLFGYVFCYATSGTNIAYLSTSLLCDVPRIRCTPGLQYVIDPNKHTCKVGCYQTLTPSPVQAWHMPVHILRPPYAMSGTGMNWAPPKKKKKNCAKSGTDIGYAAIRTVLQGHAAQQLGISLRARYAMSGSDVAYGAPTRWEYAPTSRTQLYLVSYRPTRCPVLTQRMVLPASCTMSRWVSGTESYPPTRFPVLVEPPYTFPVTTTGAAKSIARKYTPRVHLCFLVLHGEIKSQTAQSQYDLYQECNQDPQYRATLALCNARYLISLGPTRLSSCPRHHQLVNQSGKPTFLRYALPCTTTGQCAVLRSAVAHALPWSS